MKGGKVERKLGERRKEYRKGVVKGKKKERKRGKWWRD